MADLLPSTASPEPEEGEPRVLGVDSDDADEVLGALSSGTARSLLALLHEDPGTPSELADRVDTSLQNTQYHLEKLEAADLVEVCATRYSEKGREMSVYAPADGPLVLFAGDDDGSGLKQALRRFLGGVALLAVASLAVQTALGDGLPFLSGRSGGQAGALGAADAGGNAAGAAGAAGLPPGVLFFLGGALALAVACGWWYVAD